MKRLLLQYQFLEAEEEEINNAIHTCEQPMREYIMEHFPAQGKEMFHKPSAPPPQQNSQNNPEVSDETDTKDDDPKESEDEKEIAKEKLPKEPPNELRPLYKKIVAHTHPDKTPDESLWPLFMEAASAYNSKNLGKMIQIAMTCGIEVEEYVKNKEYISILENNVQTLNTYNNDRKNTFAWQWYKSTTDEEKKKIVYMLFKTKNITFNPEDIHNG